MPSTAFARATIRKFIRANPSHLSPTNQRANVTSI
jgi:hypothetical protein